MGIPVIWNVGSELVVETYKLPVAKAEKERLI